MKAIVDALRAAPGGQKRKVVLLGVSMGGAACWLATGLGARVDGIVTEGAFARFEDAMNRWFERAVPGGSVILQPVMWIASARTGLKPSDVVPLRAAEAWRGKPALIIQGDEDTLVQMPQAEALANAAKCELWTVKGAKHAHCAEVAGKAYVERLERFADAL